ncbi:MAG: hypothetical protein GEU95_14255 [Rhizobiales bacterium]|nr:hypothetical protein [Hyphomicrobiales bacterium]
MAAGVLGLAATPAKAQPENAQSGKTQSVAEFYGGKQITMIVGSTPGGGYDTQARLVSRHIGRHIAGNPTVVVQNTLLLMCTSPSPR